MGARQEKVQDAFDSQADSCHQLGLWGLRLSRDLYTLLQALSITFSESEREVGKGEKADGLEIRLR